jgi:pimeloyl-ACP methyl ester carboxylesterase
MNRPTLVMIPCFSGAPWQLEQLTALQNWPKRTLRLPDDVSDVEVFADLVQQEIQDLDSFVLVGDSFGAVISLAIAVRRPAGLRALVISGGFARNPINSPWLKLLAMLAPYFPGLFYSELTLRVHAFNLRSRFDLEGEVPWSTTQTRELFAKETPHQAYVNRIRSVRESDYTGVLHNINVPTLILTPEDDRLIGRGAAQILLQGIADAAELILPRTGHMFRFSHPSAYSTAIAAFLGNALHPR